MWTQARVDMLRELVADPTKPSAAVIADAIGGVSRNAVIGKVNRLGLSLPNKGRNQYSVGRPRAPRQARQPRTAKLPRGGFSTVPVEPTPPPAPVVVSYDHMIPFAQLENENCRFPLWSGDPPMNEKLYCGAPTANLAKGHPYCPAHCAIAGRYAVPYAEGAE